MKPIRLLYLSVLLLIGASCFGQIAPPNYYPDGQRTFKRGLFVFESLNVPKVNVLAIHPKGADSAGAILFNTADSSGYDYTGHSFSRRLYWRDSANLFPTKTSLRDSVQNRVTRIYRKPGSDSVFSCIYNNCTFAYKDTTGSSQNFANADLTLAGNRTHDGGGFALAFQSFDEIGMQATNLSFNADSTRFYYLGYKADTTIWKVLKYNPSGNTIAYGPYTGGGGSTYTYKEAIKESSGVVTLNNKRDVIITDQTFTSGSLPGTFTAVGSPSYTADASGLHFTGFGSSTFSKYIRSNKATMVEGGEITLYFKVDGVTGTDSAFAVGFQSINSNGYTHNVMLEWIADASSPNKGKLHFFGATGSYNLYSDSAKTAYQLNDQFSLSIHRDGLNYIGKVRNLTQGWSLSLTAVATTPVTPYVPHNTAYPGFYHRGGSFTATRFSYIVHSPLVLKWIIKGNSIVLGQGADSPLTRWASNVGIPSNNIVGGGGADVTAQVVATLDEIIALNPYGVLLDIGGNDILFGVSAATWKANLVTIYNTLTAAGIEVVFVYPNPRTATDISALPTYIDTCNVFNLAVKIRTPWTQMLGSGTSLLAVYDADGTHPNTAGHQFKAYLVNVGLKFPVTQSIVNGSSSMQANSSLWVSGLVKTSGRLEGTDAGTGPDQFLAGGMIVRQNGSSTQYIQVGHYGGYAYAQGVNQGTGYTHLVLSPAAGSRVGVRETSPTATIDIKNNDAGDATFMNGNHQGSYSAVGQELRFDWQNAHNTVTRIANYLDASTSFGWKLYCYSGGAMNSTPALTLKGIGNKAGFNNANPLSTVDITGAFRVSDTTALNGPVYIPTAPAGTSVDSIHVSEDGRLKIITAAQIVTGANVISDNYTPTITSNSNYASSSGINGKYSRNGKIVTVYIMGVVTATSGGSAVVFEASLPIASNMTTATDVIGNGIATYAGSAEVCFLSANTTDDRVIIATSTIASTNDRSFSVSFQYEIK